MDLIQQARIFLSYLFIQKSYSQLGEDLVIINHFEWLGKDTKSKGFYVDIGAYHPFDASNTYQLYLKGSSGIAVDVGSLKEFLFKLIRRRDTFINAAVVPDDFQEQFVSFNIEGYGSPVDSVVGYGAGETITQFGPGTQKVKAIPISELLELSFSMEQAYNANWSLLNIDIEGMDEEVMTSSFSLTQLPMVIIVAAVWFFLNLYALPKLGIAT